MKSVSQDGQEGDQGEQRRRACEPHEEEALETIGETSRPVVMHVVQDKEQWTVSLDWTILMLAQLQQQCLSMYMYTVAHLFYIAIIGLLKSRLGIYCFCR